MATAIVGAGAAGLSLALMLDGPFQLFEREREPGGLCRSHRDADWTWDHGPHILGGIPEAVAWVVETTPGVEFVAGSTRNRAWVDGAWAEHPFRREQDVTAYMRKMWKADNLRPGGLGAQAGRRPGGVSEFLYPRHGGYQSITDAWADRLADRLFLSSPVAVEDLLDEFEHIVWTAPRGAGRYNSLATVTTCCYGRRPDWSAVYLPGDDTPFHRLSCTTAFSPFNAPEDGYAIQAEATYNTEAWVGYWPHLHDRLLADLGVEAVGDHVLEHTHFAYPVPTVELTPSNGDHGPLYHGRTGAYKYLNIDGVVAESLRLAEYLNALSH